MKRSTQITTSMGKAEVDEAFNSVAAWKAVHQSKFASFDALVGRLRSDAPLVAAERAFLAELLGGTTEFKIVWKDGRKRQRLEKYAREMELAHAVFVNIMMRGLSLEQACVAADDELGTGDSRPATAREAYNKHRQIFWPPGSNEI